MALMLYTTHCLYDGPEGGKYYSIGRKGFLSYGYKESSEHGIFLTVEDLEDELQSGTVGNLEAEDASWRVNEVLLPAELILGQSMINRIERKISG